MIAREDGRCLLLDIQGNRVLHLNRVGGEIWGLLREGLTEPEIVTQISHKYQATEERVGADVRTLLKRISDLKLSPSNSAFSDLAELKRTEEEQRSYPWYGGPGTHRPHLRRTMILAALIGLMAFDLILWVGSLKLICSCVKAWPVWKWIRADSESTGRVCSAVESACIWYPKQALCLQRSAVTACLLKSCGVPAQMMIGIRPMPLLAHAWVAVDGSAVNDWPGVKNFYSSLASY